MDAAAELACAGDASCTCRVNLASMQDAPHYDDVVAEVHRFLAQRIFACEMSGIEKKRIAIDPGFGFGKTLEHNLALLRGLAKFTDLACR